MMRWKNDEIEFNASITKNKNNNTSYSYAPKPILDKLGKPSGLKFLLTDGKIIVQPGDKSELL